MPKYEVEVEITKTYVNYRTVNVYASDEGEAEDKAHDIVSGWSNGGADEVDIEIQGVVEV